jgi:hypothetical protein
MRSSVKIPPADRNQRRRQARGKSEDHPARRAQPTQDVIGSPQDYASPLAPRTPASADRGELKQPGKRRMRTAIITPRPPGYRSDAFAQHVREDGIGGWRCRRPVHPRRCCCGGVRARKAPRKTTASADASGSPVSSPAADRLCGTDLDHSSAWSARTRTAIRRPVFRIE